MTAPRLRIAAECDRNGSGALVTACIALLGGRPDEVGDCMIIVLGGDGARHVLDGGEGGRDGYWPRVWAARGLLHAGGPAATSAIIAATQDDSWRVREMAAKVIARYRVSAAFDAVAELRADPVERVRTAAARAVTVLTAAGA